MTFLPSYVEISFIVCYIWPLKHNLPSDFLWSKEILLTPSIQKNEDLSMQTVEKTQSDIISPFFSHCFADIQRNYAANSWRWARSVSCKANGTIIHWVYSMQPWTHQPNSELHCERSVSVFLQTTLWNSDAAVVLDYYTIPFKIKRSFKSEKNRCRERTLISAFTHAQCQINFVTLNALKNTRIQTQAY